MISLLHHVIFHIMSFFTFWDHELFSSHEQVSLDSLDIEEMVDMETNDEEDKGLANDMEVDDVVHMSKSGWVLSRLRRRLQNGQSLWPQ